MIAKISLKALNSKKRRCLEREIQSALIIKVAHLTVHFLETLTLLTPGRTQNQEIQAFSTPNITL